MRLIRIAVLAIIAHRGSAQYVISAHAGTINLAVGEVFMDGRSFEMKPAKFTDLRAGQTLSTSAGRAEVLLGPGVFLRLDNRGVIRMLTDRLEDVRVEVLQGTALVEVVKLGTGNDVHVILGHTVTAFKGIGLHRFNADSKQLRVFGGRAEVSAGRRSAVAERGSAVQLDDTLRITGFDPRHAKDELHQWAARRSYELYRVTLNARAHPTNWEVTRVSPTPDKFGTRTDQDRFYFYNRDFNIGWYFLPQRPGQPAEQAILPN